MPDPQSPMTHMDPWIGSEVSSRRVLILGESWYGEESDNLFDYLSGWCQRTKRDYFFSRVFNAASGFHTKTATDPQRAAFWNSVLFDNFINQSIGQTRDCRPDESHFKAAARSFPNRLQALHPNAVWVLGKEQARYSVPILKEVNCPHVVSPHPCGRGVTRESLKNAWMKLIQGLS
jgi:hypothetical protein